MIKLISERLEFRYQGNLKDKEKYSFEKLKIPNPFIAILEIKGLIV